MDANGTAAAIRAGYAPRSASVRAARLAKDREIAEAIREGQAETARRLELDRERVLDGLLEAVEIARAGRDAGAMIRAWAEIARLSGFYAPERRTVEVVAKSGRLLDQLETMSDAALLKMVAAAETGT